MARETPGERALTVWALVALNPARDLTWYPVAGQISISSAQRTAKRSAPPQQASATVASGIPTRGPSAKAPARSSAQTTMVPWESGEDTSIRRASTHRGRLLEVDLRELRATWLMHGTSPDIVLYDGISGRAGYARRIGEISRCVACSKVCSTS
jgi:hypothetical protein